MWGYHFLGVAHVVHSTYSGVVLNRLLHSIARQSDRVLR